MSSAATPARFSRDLVRVIRKCSPDVSVHTLPRDFANMYKPGVQINNVAFENSLHRKLHIEAAQLGMVHVTHAVMYPRPRFDVPIVAMDLVTVGNTPTFGIVDACPVTDDLRLPEEYRKTLETLRMKYGFQAVARETMPAWGQAIFSDECVMQRKGHGVLDGNLFCSYALDVLAMHLLYCKDLEPSRDHRRIRQNHSRFCRYQLKNDRTRALLASSLGGDLALANEYMNRVMFDV